MSSTNNDDTQREKRASPTQFREHTSPRPAKRPSRPNSTEMRRSAITQTTPRVLAQKGRPILESLPIGLSWNAFQKAFRHSNVFLPDTFGQEVKKQWAAYTALQAMSNLRTAATPSLSGGAAPTARRSAMSLVRMRSPNARAPSKSARDQRYQSSAISNLIAPLIGWVEENIKTEEDAIRFHAPFMLCRSIATASRLVFFKNKANDISAKGQSSKKISKQVYVNKSELPSLHHNISFTIPSSSSVGGSYPNADSLGMPGVIVSLPRLAPHLTLIPSTK
eukprot:SAG11_NODE_4288_length_1968_cov_1.046014_2_plen_278_part_00